MNTQEISTSIAAVCAGLALLAPLVKSLSAWHIALRKLPKPKKTKDEPQSGSSAIDQPTIPLGWQRFFLFHSIARRLMVFYGIAMLSVKGLSQGSLQAATVHDVAYIAILLVIVIQGSSKD
jgi:hypothetical protein